MVGAGTVWQDSNLHPPQPFPGANRVLSQGTLAFELHTVSYFPTRLMDDRSRPRWATCRVGHSLGSLTVDGSLPPRGVITPLSLHEFASTVLRRHFPRGPVVSFEWRCRQQVGIEPTSSPLWGRHHQCAYMSPSSSTVPVAIGWWNPYGSTVGADMWPVSTRRPVTLHAGRLLSH